MSRISWCKARRLGAMLGAGALIGGSAAAQDAGVGFAAFRDDPPRACETALDGDWSRAADEMQSAAELCAEAMIADWGAADPRLMALYDALADAIAGAPKRAWAALPMRARADALAIDLYGAESVAAGETALAYARTLILAGRCDGLDPIVGDYLSRAQVSFAGAEDPVRRARGLRALGAAYADVRAPERAAETLLMLGAELRPRDWRLIAQWRTAHGDAAGAEAALRAGLDAARGRIRTQILLDLRAMLVERSDFDGLSELPTQ